MLKTVGLASFLFILKIKIAENENIFSNLLTDGKNEYYKYNKFNIKRKCADPTVFNKTRHSWIDHTSVVELLNLFILNVLPTTEGG